MDKEGNLFARLLVTHDRELRRYVTMLLLRSDDVEEVLQRTAVVLWQKFEEYDRSRDFLPWAMRVAYFEVLAFKREHARSKLVFSEEVMEQLTTDRAQASSALNARRAAMRDCVSKLSESDQRLLNRRYDETATLASLAEETGRTMKSLYRRLDRIRAAIVACVDQTMVSDGGGI